MMNKNLSLKILLMLPLFVMVALVAQGQNEVISPLRSNAVIKSALFQQQSGNAQYKQAAAIGDTLFLPFFDDFSKVTVWPSADRWTDSSSFVNYNFPINPPTLGAVTFDGLDKMGNAYDNVNANAVGLCDELTSKHINLEFDENGLPYDVTDSIFFVFYFQRKGRGDNPEVSDSLALHFFNAVTQSWVPVWKTTGGVSGDTVFNKVKISINDPDLRQNGFRFRFRNYGSRTGMLDLWNVDYVYLNKFLPPDYEFQRDYAYVYEGTSLLNTYSAVPWKHFIHIPVSQQQSMVKSSAKLTIRNNNDAVQFPVKVSGTIYDQFGNPTPIVGGGGANNIIVPLNSNVNPPSALLTNSFFQDPGANEQAVFTAVYDIGQTGGGAVDDFPVNDTLSYVQNFHDYYAYDDGSAELAYGINGIGSQLAYKFDILKGDTLRAVHMYFAQSGLNVTNQIFRLAVWSGGAGGPNGAPVYEKFNQTPNYVDSINGFYTYHIDPFYLSAGTWFVGFIQNNAVLLNLGLDVNTPADASRKFINTSGSWVNSQLPGMWMIRPVFSEEPLFTSVEQADDLNDFSVYPNPANDFIYLNSSVTDYENYSINLVDVTGRVVIKSNKFVDQLETKEITTGFYSLIISNKVSGKRFNQKIIIAR